MRREAATEIGAEIMTRKLGLLQSNLYFCDGTPFVQVDVR